MELLRGLPLGRVDVDLGVVGDPLLVVEQVEHLDKVPQDRRVGLPHQMRVLFPEDLGGLVSEK